MNRSIICGNCNHGDVYNVGPDDDIVICTYCKFTIMLDEVEWIDEDE